MHDQFEDEVARRREARRRQKAAQAENGEQRDDEEDEIPQLGWSDTFAMIIAAYQVLFPMVLAMAGVMLLGYLLFRFVFT